MKFKFTGKDNKVKYLGTYLKNGQELELNEENYEAFNNKGLLVKVVEIKEEIKKSKKRGKK